MSHFLRLNKIFGWAIFFIALATYAITMEKTGSLWDCGEFVSCVYRLQVAHPPGAPFFIIIGKLFTLLSFGDPSKVAMMVNFMSAMSTAFCSLFFFWSSTMLLRMAFVKNEEISSLQTNLIIGTSFIGALAATFLDSMWFNAVEGEVYALSVFFMALNVWAILKWNEDNSASADKWLLIIALCTGISTGVHLLSLLVFPIITLVFYLKKFKPTLLGIILSFVLGIILIVFVMSFILSVTPGILGGLDLLFVNSFGLPFYSGAIFGTILFIALFYYLLSSTNKNPNFLGWNESKTKISLNTVFLFITFLYMGFFSYFLVVIRANANTPINMNVPNNFKTLKSYIDRDQYGKRPLASGPYYSDVYEISGYAKLNDMYEMNEVTKKYELVGQYNTYEYPKEVKKLFPRVGHEGDDKKQMYRAWINPSEYNVVNRSTGETVQSFGQGQAEQAEQFAQQQNAQGKGEFVVKDKITFADNLGFFLKYQMGFMYFRYFMWNFAGRTDDNQATLGNDFGRWQCGIPAIDNALGDLWGIPVIDIALDNLGNAGFDQTDKPATLSANKGHNSFYLIPLILCLLGMYYSYKRDKEVFGIIMMLFFATGAMQILYHNQPPIEPRERDYVSAPSFWSFVFWLPFGIWFIYDLLATKTSKNIALALSLVIGASAPFLMGTQGWDDHNRGGRTSTLDFASNMLNSCPPNAILFTYGDNDTYPLWYAQEVEGIRTDVRVINTSLIEGSPYIEQMRLPMNHSATIKLSVPKEAITGDRRSMMYYSPDKTREDTISLQEFIKLATTEGDYSLQTRNGETMNAMPSTNVYIDIDPAKAVKSGMIAADKINTIPTRIYFSFGRGNMSKGALIQYDVIANNLYERPIVFASTNPQGLVISSYLQEEGMVSRFSPTAPSGMPNVPNVNADVMYKNLMSYKFGNIKNGILVDQNTYRSYMNMKDSYSKLAIYLALTNKKDSTNKLIDYLYNNMPSKIIKLDAMDVSMIQALIIVGNKKKADEMMNELYQNATKELDWITKDGNVQKANPNQEEVRLNMYSLNYIKDLATQNSNPTLSKKAAEKFESYNKSLMQFGN